MTFVKTTPFGEVLKNVLLILMKLMSMAQFCILMQENALLMKNINTKVKKAQKTLVENFKMIMVIYMIIALIPKMKLIANKRSSFVNNPNPVLISPRFAMELSIAFLVKMKASSYANPPFLKLPLSNAKKLIERAMIYQF